MTIHMAKITLGPKHITDPALQLSRIGETAIALAVPDHAIIEPDLEESAGTGHQRDRTEVGTEA